MKRFLLFISISLMTFSISTGQHSTMSFGGAITGNASWNNYDTIYVIGNITIDEGASLAINPRSLGTDIGTYIIFLGDYGITITSTGALNVNGTSSENIVFTADRAETSYPIGDKNFGETGETWKNITFELSLGTSVINHAIIEHGTGNDNYGLGGGIIIYGDNITINNSTIQDCTVVGDGGGIYLYPTGTNVILQNCIACNNSATGNGGGLVIDGEGAATVTGCNIYNNSAGIGAGVFILYTNGTLSNSIIHDHNPGEGVYISDVVTNASLSNCILYNNATGIYFSGIGNSVNCDIVNNIIGITTLSSTASKVVNTVLWGNTTEYDVSGGSLELANCGIEGGLAGGMDGGGNITLNSINNDNSGPNFLSPSTSDFHLNAWITPLVDGGTASYTGVTVPGTDIEGKGRLSTIDIGAFEFIYYIWTGISSRDWSTSSNWSGTPASIPTTITDNKVIIPKGCPNYPLVSSLTLSTRSILTIEPEAGLEVTGSTVISTGCTFVVESDATGSGNFISGSSVSGTFNVELFVDGGGGPYYKWHYVTIPINSTNFTKVGLTTEINNTYNLLDYRENLVTTDKNAGWNWHDGYNSTPGFSTLTKNRGYNVYIDTDDTATFEGTVLPGADFINSSITCGVGDTEQRGWNLIGNPFPCSVDADQFVLTAKIVDKAIYFTKDNMYMSYNTFTHVGAGVSNIVPPLQGFFVHAVSGIGARSVTIPAVSRQIHASNSIYKGDAHYDKSKGTQTFPYLKFNVSDNVSFTDESIIYFFEDATQGFDVDYDAYKMFSENPANPQIYSINGSITFSINGLPIPDNKTIVPVNIRIGEAKNYTLNILNLENLVEYRVTLIHGTNRIDLKSNPNYTFFASAGTLSDMFIEFDMSLTDIDVPNLDNTACWYSNGSLFIKSNLTGFEISSILTIYDLNGRIVFTRNKLSLNNGEILELPLDLPNGLYITTLTNSSLRINKKIVIAD